jgi:hypothetical protein
VDVTSGQIFSGRREEASLITLLSQELPSPVRLPHARYFARTAPTEGPALILADYNEQ